MQPKKILCKACSAPIAEIQNDKLIISDMKALSIVEVNIIDNSKDIKCRCGSWNSFTPENVQSINYQRKGNDALYATYRPSTKTGKR
jgi:hypothetical protein